MNRPAAVAGTFYPGTRSRLEELVDQLMPVSASPRKAFGVISPHAGYVYSGSVAGKVFGAVRIPDTALLLGPNHTGKGVHFSLYPSGNWNTPMGLVPINSKLNTLLLRHCPGIKEDRAAHEREHSLETQLPFLLRRQPALNFSALCIGTDNTDALLALGEGIAAAIHDFGSELLMVASSDMTHYESEESAKRKDFAALEQALKLDERALLQITSDLDISMCGRAPAAVMLKAAKLLGASKAELLDYTHSGRVTGDLSSVVAYAGVLLL